MKQLILTRRLGFLLMLLFWMSVGVIHAQEQPVPDSRNPVFVCIFRDGGAKTNLIKVLASEPFGMTFSERVSVIVYSSAEQPVIADVIHIEPDTVSGTYRRSGDVVRGAYTTSNIPEQRACQTPTSSQIESLNRTIILPLFPNQGLAVHPIDVVPSYDDPEATLFIGSIGLLFRDRNTEADTTNSFPHFQILRFNGGNNDTISIAFPDFTSETSLYAVSRQLTSYTETNAGDVVSQSKFMENRPFFMSLLEARGEKLIETILMPGNFRMYVAYGEAITYKPGTLLNLTRLSSFEARVFEDDENPVFVAPIECSGDLPFFRPANYEQHIYFRDHSVDRVGVIRCGEKTEVEAVLKNGILVVKGGFHVASWLVDPV